MRNAVATSDDGDTIVLSSAVRGAIVLTSGRLLVNRKLTINGPGATRLAIDGNQGDYPVFVLDDSTHIDGLTIRNAHDVGIENLADSELSNCVVSGNDISGIYRWMDVFIKRRGQWQLISEQGTQIPRRS